MICEELGQKMTLIGFSTSEQKATDSCRSIQSQNNVFRYLLAVSSMEETVGRAALKKSRAKMYVKYREKAGLI